MNASILRAVLAVAIVLGFGVAANIFSNKPHGAYKGDSGGATAASTGRTLAPGTIDRAAEQARLLAGVRGHLRDRGYLARPVADGGVDADVLTRAAILAFEFDYHLVLTAEPGEPLLKALIFTQTKAGAAPSAPPTESARNLIEAVQRALAHLGYGEPEASGAIDTATRAAIAKFERARGLEVSGRISAPLIESLGPAFEGARSRGLGANGGARNAG